MTNNISSFLRETQNFVTLFGQMAEMLFGFQQRESLISPFLKYYILYMYTYISQLYISHIYINAQKNMCRDILFTNPFHCLELKKIHAFINLIN